MRTMDIFRNYEACGVSYTYGCGSRAAINSELITVTIPDEWKSQVTYGKMILIAPWEPGF